MELIGRGIGDTIPNYSTRESGEFRAKQTSSDWQRDAELFLNTVICQSLSGWIDRKGIGDRIENYSTGKASEQTSDWQRNTELSLNVVLPQYHNTMVPQCHSATIPRYHSDMHGTAVEPGGATHRTGRRS